MRILLLSCLLAVPFVASAQDHGLPCLANHTAELARHLAAHPGERERALDAQAALEARTHGFDRAERGGGTAFIIPVVFHIIHDNGYENIGDAQVYDAVRVLNDDYNKLNVDWPNVRPAFLDRVADVGIEFRLATLDPWGNCTNGITRTVSDRTHDGDFEMTQLIQWPRDRYLNIWVAASADGAAGYTYYPMWLHNWPEADGIVVLHEYVGTIGTGSPFRSRVLTHEVGHWLNLAHCWGDSNEPGDEANCSMDDGVEDTPNTKGWQSCNLNGASCGSPLDNVENYMEYSYCCKMFTNGQADRMIAALTSNIAQRSNLWQASNLALTGVTTEPVLCAAAFTRSRNVVCVGDSVRYADISYHGVTGRSWSFPGAMPANAVSDAITVRYGTPGVHTATLTVTDGVNEITVQQDIVVLPDTGHAVPFIEGFEGMAALPNSEWTVHDPDGDGGFTLTTAAAHSGTHAVMLANNAGMDGHNDNLYSPTYDMTGATDVTVSFRYAYAQRNAGNDDRLRLYISNDCGTVWSMRDQLRGTSDLNTGGITGGNFVPGPDQWREVVVSNISANNHVPDFRVRFEFLSRGGNNVWIDDINISGTAVGIAELLGSTGGALVVPNPATNNAELRFDLPAPATVEVDVLDVTGRLLAQAHTGRLGSGTQRVALPVEGLPAGVYLVRLRHAGNTAVVRFAIDRS